MLNNYFTINEVAKYLNNVVSNYFINEIYTQEKNKLIFKFYNESHEIKILEFSVEKKFNFLLVRNNYSKAKKNFAGLFEELSDKKISGIELYNDDRAIKFKMQDDFEIIFTFFSNKANCFLIQKGIIQNAFKEREEYFKKDISETIPLNRSPGEVQAAIAVTDFLKKKYRRYGDLYLKEIIYRNNLNGADEVTDDIINKIKTGFKEIDKELEKPEFLLYSDHDCFYLSLIRLKHLNALDVKALENINELISEFVTNKFKTEKTGQLKQNRLAELNNKLFQIEKKIKSVKTQLERSEDSERIKQFGNSILQNIHRIKKGDVAFTYVSGDGEQMSIKLKPELLPSDNAKSYFEKYKKHKSSVEILKEKIEMFEKEKTKLGNELQRINNMTEYKSLLKEEKKSIEIKNDETSRFRKFRLNDKHEVWVGKDSASNDLLTTKYAAPNDIWFHVRGSSGSHTILKVNNKKESVEKELINRAASIAAYYSKARNASSVPVAYCEKKYVKKKKGFKQGTVIMEREKVIFVKPGLPDEVNSQ